MEEKRQFFRIQQDVIFSFRHVTTDAMTHNNAEEHFDHSGALGLFSQFQQLDNDCNSLLDHIREKDATTAAYLMMLNQKINLLSQQMLSTEAVSASDRESGRVDLSQGGLGFTAPNPIGIESWLAVKLVFLPAYTCIVTYAQVTRNQMLDDGSYLIGARFYQLNEEQERVIAKQVMQTQLTQKRQQKSQMHH